MRAMKQILTGHLTDLREAVVWKLEGVGERAARTPMTPTGTNLLGLVKHLGLMEAGYFGDVFGRPADDPMARLDAVAWADDADLWATPDETMPVVMAFYARSTAHADETIRSRDLDSPAFVPWWPQPLQNTTLGAVLVHVIAETARHAGHIDILREQLDGRVGTHPDSAGVLAHDAEWRAAYTSRLRDLAASAPE